MPYTAEISRQQPTAFFFLIDQSGSMSDTMASGRSKAQFLSDVLNRTLENLVTRCTKSDGTRHYFDIGIIGYGGNDSVGSGFAGDLNSSIVHPISLLETPVRLEERRKLIDDGAGGLVEKPIPFRVWVDPQANGGTPMCHALVTMAEELVAWCDSHPKSYPPTVLHITDGQSTDGDPEELGSKLSQIHTDDGSVLVFNLHVSTLNVAQVKFPSFEIGLPDTYASLLFRMSSPLTDLQVNAALEKGYQVTSGAKGFMFNAEAPEIVDFFDIGTRSNQMR